MEKIKLFENAQTFDRLKKMCQKPTLFKEIAKSKIIFFKVISIFDGRKKNICKLNFSDQIYKSPSNH